jgi:N-acylneuraminate cytidylyltransferase
VAPLIHAVTTLPEKYDFIVLLQPTSPLRSAEDIDGCIKKCISGGYKSCVSVTEPDKSPFWMFYVGKNGFMRPLLKSPKTYCRRQDLPRIYAVNGAVYVAERKWLLKTESLICSKTVAVKMPAERSLDIDNELDVLKMEAFLKFKNMRVSR